MGNGVDFGWGFPPDTGERLPSAVQRAWLVSSLEESVVSLEERGWADGFVVREHPPLANSVGAGVLEHRSAYGRSLLPSVPGCAERVMVELVQVEGEPPPAFAGHRLDGPAEHHRAHAVPCLDDSLEQLAEAGEPTLFRSESAGGVRFAMVDTTARLGWISELYQRSEHLEVFYRRILTGTDG